MKNDNYDHFAKTFSESRKNMKWGELDAILEDIEKNNLEKILDVGCGSGRFLEFYLKKFGKFPAKYLGIDNSAKILEEAKQSFPEVDFMMAEMQDVDENFSEKISEKFDAIVLLASFHHVSDKNLREKILENLKFFLSENGKIYITNWNLKAQEKYKNSEKFP